jgi:hypothetical protein
MKFLRRLLCRLLDGHDWTVVQGTSPSTGMLAAHVVCACCGKIDSWLDLPEVDG